MVAIYEGSIQQLRGYVVVQFTTCWCTPSGCRYGHQRRTVSVRHPEHPDGPALLLHHVRPTSIQGELNDTQKRAMGIDPDRIHPVVHTCVYCHSPAGQECPPGLHPSHPPGRGGAAAGHVLTEGKDSCSVNPAGAPTAASST